MNKAIKDRFWRKVSIKNPRECWEWLAAKNNCGYGTFKLTKGKSWLSHRVAYLLEFGEIPKSKYVLHSCDNPACVNPKHLYIGTQFENMRDKSLRGRDYDRNGERNSNAKLTEILVDRLRAEYEKRETTQETLSRKFNISPAQVHNIVARKSWTMIAERERRMGDG